MLILRASLSLYKTHLLAKIISCSVQLMHRTSCEHLHRSECVLVWWPSSNIRITFKRVHVDPTRVCGYFWEITENQFWSQRQFFRQSSSRFDSLHAVYSVWRDSSHKGITWHCQPKIWLRNRNRNRLQPVVGGIENKKKNRKKNK